MKRSGWSWTAGLLLVAVALLGLATLRLFECGVCGGANLRKQASNPNRYGDEATSCPACLDRGRVRLLALLRSGPVDPRLLELLRVPPGADRGGVVASAFQGLLRSNGAASRFVATSSCEFSSARFVRAEEGDVVVVCGEHATWSGNGSGLPIALAVHSRQYWLFDFQGRLLDAFAFESSDDAARPELRCLSERESEDAHVGALEIEVRNGGGISRRPTSSRIGLRIWQGELGDLDPAQWFEKGRARFRIAGGKFVRIPPR